MSATLLKRKGTTERRIVRAEDDGSVAGILTEHWDDHVDAKAFARPKILVPPGGLILPDGRRIVEAKAHDLLEQVRTRKGKLLPAIGGSAFANSGLYVLNWIDILDATQLAIDLSLTTHKWALYTNTETPNFSSETAYSTTNEVTGTGYTAGGQVIVGPTVTESPAGTLMYDMNDQVWAAPTTVTARGGKLYADALAGNNLIVAMTFGGSDIVSTAGTFTIAFNALGVFTIDLTP